MDGTSQTPVVAGMTAGEPLSVERFFTTRGVHPFDTVEWELRDARIAHGDRVAFNTGARTARGRRGSSNDTAPMHRTDRPKQANRIETDFCISTHPTRLSNLGNATRLRG